MLESTQQLVKSWYEELDDAIGHRAHISIKGLVIEEPVTVYSLDGEVLSTCNHAGHFTGMVQSDNSDNFNLVEAEVCDKCPAVMNDEGEWA